MGEILMEYPSASKPGTSYNIVRGRDGVVYCTCWAWKINKRCEHLISFFGQLQRQAKSIKPIHVVNAPAKTVSKVSELMEAIDVAFWNQEGGKDADNKAEQHDNDADS